MTLSRMCVVLSPSFPYVEFDLAQIYYKVTQEDPVHQLSGFKNEVGVIEESGVPKEPDMVNKIDIRGVLQDGDVIEDRSEGHMYIDFNNLPALDNLPLKNQ